MAAQLARLKEEEGERTREIAGKERELVVLSEKLAAVRGDMNTQKQEHQSRITELSMSAAVLQCRIEGQSRFSRELDPLDQRLIEEMHESTKAKVDIYKRTQNQEISRKIEDLQEAVLRTEQSLSTLIAQHDMARSEIPQDRRRLKDGIQLKSRAEREEVQRKRQSEREAKKKRLRLELSEGREVESSLATSLSEKERTESALKVRARQLVRERRERLYLQIDNLRAIRQELKERIADNQERIEIKENELAEVKCMVLSPGNME
jgi:DNA-dependent RNA polymerase auxiliary subunit epsilon